MIGTFRTIEWLLRELGVLEPLPEPPPPPLSPEEEAWRTDSGADLVPAPEGAPHVFGGDLWAVPACRGCGHPIHAWFTLDLDALPTLAAKLPGWRSFPLLGCADCGVWMGRHDYAIHPVERRLELLDVGISTSEFGTANVTAPAIPAQPAALRERPRPPPEDFPERPQVGGAPDWIQGPVDVRCPACDGEMAFVAAMASPEEFEPAIPVNNESGYQYHFACAGCRRVSVVAQWT